MHWFIAYSLLATSFSITSAADLKGSIASSGISTSFPGDASYSSASAAFNQRFTLAPAAVVYPKTAQDVSKIVKIGVSQGLKVVARSGGHSYIANGLGGRNGSLVVDLKNLSKVTVNSAQGTAIIETGNRLGDVATALANEGRALPHGTCAYVGIGGHAAYGGFGYTSRMWGLTLDTVKAVNVVLANGTVTRVTNNNNPELFWGLRGSAGSFGIVTSYEVATFQAPPAATIFEYSWNLNSKAAAKAISVFENFAQTNIPSTLGASLVLGKGYSSGTVYFALSGGWYGPADGLAAVLAPFLTQMPAKPNTSLKKGNYIQSVAAAAGGTLDTKSEPETKDTFYVKSIMTPASAPMSNAAISTFTSYLASQGFQSKTEWFIEMDLYGGKNSAVNAIGADVTAFAHRSSTFTIQLYASAPGYKPPFPQYGFNFVEGAANAIISNSPADWPYRAYINYIDDKLADWKLRYYGNHYTRLQALKAKYDPQDLFDFPTAITK